MRGDKVILFVPHYNYTLHDMMPIALRMRDQFGYHIYFAIEWMLNNKTGIEECDKYGMNYILVGAAQNADQGKVFKGKGEPPKRRTVLKFLKAFKKFPVVSLPSEFIWQVIYQYGMRRVAIRLIRNLNPSVVVVYRDDRPRVSTFITHIANGKGIPTVLFPGPIIYPCSAMAFGCVQKGYTLSNCGFMERLIYRFSRFVIPNMTYNWDRETVLFLPPEVALVAWFNGIFPENPWIMGGGKARWVAVATSDDYERLIEAGISQDSIVVTGFPPFDQFYEKNHNAEREVLCQKLNIPKDSFIICYCATPKQNEKKDMFLYVSFKEHAAQERFAVDALLNMSNKVHIIFKLHPRSRSGEYDYLPIHHPRLSVIRDIGINNVIAGSDLFVTHASSAIFTAVALKKPILSFRFQNDPIYEIITGSLEGIYQSSNHNEFKVMARRVFHDCCSDGLKREIMAKEANRYAICDGNSTRRFAGVVHSLTEHLLEDPRIGLGKVQNG